MPFSCCEPRFPPRYSNSPPYSNSPHLIVCPTVTLGADLPGKPRADGVPHTPRVLAYKVEDAITTAKSAARLPEVPPCDRHWDERFDDAAPLTPEQQRAAASLGFGREAWIEDAWDAIATWTNLTAEQQSTALLLGFTPRSWRGGGATLDESALDSAANVAKKQRALNFFRSRAPSHLPEMLMDVLGQQLHPPQLPPAPAPSATEPVAPPASPAVRACVQGAIAGVLRKQKEERSVAAVEWMANEIATRGPSNAVRYRRAGDMPPALRELTLHLNAMREPRATRALEAAYPLQPPSAPDAPATMGGTLVSLPALWAGSRLSHATRYGAVRAAPEVARDASGEVRVTLRLSLRASMERCGFASVAQLLTERRVELAVDDPAVKPADVWDECAVQEMHAQRIALQRDEGIRFERRYYHPYPRQPHQPLWQLLALVFCESHNMKTSGQNLAGLAQKAEESALLKHAHLLAVARALAEKEKKYAPLVAALQKAVDMQSQAVFGNLFSCQALLDGLRAAGHLREWAFMSVMQLRWRACDQRGLSWASRILAIEVLDVLLIGNVCGRALFCPGKGSGRDKGHAVGVRSGFFQGLPWQTLLGRLSNDGMHGWMGEELPPALRFIWVIRTFAQNDLESIFGCVVDGHPTKMPPCLMEPKFQDAEFMDFVKNDAERAESWKTSVSKRAMYDAVNSMESLQAAFDFCNGVGDRFDSPLSVSWRDKQELGAVRAAQGKQESARTNNTFFSDARALAGGGIKRQAVGQ
jgi:hypothetical protein